MGKNQKIQAITRVVSHGGGLDFFAFSHSPHLSGAAGAIVCDDFRPAVTEAADAFLHQTAGWGDSAVIDCYVFGECVDLGVIVLDDRQPAEMVWYDRRGGGTGSDCGQKLCRQDGAIGRFGWRISGTNHYELCG